MGDSERIFEADLTWTGSRFEAGIQVAVDSAGMIVEVSKGGLAREPSERLAGLALLPGFVNAHSHAFQRGLRGRGETFPGGAGSFWSWREEMYGLVEELDEQSLYRLCLQCYREMLAAGITCVGEFHYLHHISDGEDFGFDPVVLQAAADSGLRLVLLQAYYRTGGIGKPLGPRQQRFLTSSPEAYWRQMDRLQKLLDPATQTLGAVVHSVRAAPVEEIAEIHQESQRRGLVLHMHVEEQRQELEQCRVHYGVDPLTLLQRELEIDDGFTAVHCTHTSGGRLSSFLRRGASVCLCPLTEANLGDGVPDLPAILEAGGRACLGTDSNARISFLEEMRWLEYVQRLRREQRGVWLDKEGSVGRRLLQSATTGGAQSLGMSAGRLESGRLADFVCIDLKTPPLQGATPDTLLDCLIFGAGNSVFKATYVAGRRV